MCHRLVYFHTRPELVETVQMARKRTAEVSKETERVQNAIESTKVNNHDHTKTKKQRVKGKHDVMTARQETNCKACSHPYVRQALRFHMRTSTRY